MHRIHLLSVVVPIRPSCWQSTWKFWFFLSRNRPVAVILNQVLTLWSKEIRRPPGPLLRSTFSSKTNWSNRIIIIITQILLSSCEHRPLSMTSICCCTEHPGFNLLLFFCPWSRWDPSRSYHLLSPFQYSFGLSLIILRAIAPAHLHFRWAIRRTPHPSLCFHQFFGVFDRSGIYLIWRCST